MRARFGCGALIRAILWSILLGCAGKLSAHELGGGLEPDDLWQAWPLEPGVLIPLLTFGVLYAYGVSRFWSGGKTGRGIGVWEASCFAAGWIACFIALASPVHPLGSVLFAAHMTQHEILMLLAAPLFVLGRPLIAILKAFPASLSGHIVRTADLAGLPRIWRPLINPFVAWLVHTLVLWMWHAPFLFNAALESETIHALQHISFLGSALLFWWAVIHGRHRGVSFGAAVVYMFSTALHSGLLGAIITLAKFVIYPSYNTTNSAWGLTPLEDQQLGGLIMWIPACSVYIVAGLLFFAGWLRASEKSSNLVTSLPAQTGTL